MSRVEGTGVTVPFNPQPLVEEEGVSVIALLNSDDQLALELGGDTQAQLAAMVLKHGAERREDLDETRGQQEQYVRKMEQEQVSKMRTEAKHLRDKAQIEGATKLAGSAFQFGGVIAGSGEGGDGRAWAAMGGAATASGELIGAGEGFEANMANADAVAAEHRAQEGLRRIDALLEDIDDIKDFEDAGREFVKAVQDIEAQTNNAVLFERI